MPANYRIDAERKRILTRCEGNAVAEVLAHFDELELDANARPARTRSST